MTKITNRKIKFLFSRPTGKGNQRSVSFSDKYFEYLAFIGSAAFRYRSAFANRPTQPRRRFV